LLFSISTAVLKVSQCSSLHHTHIKPCPDRSPRNVKYFLSPQSILHLFGGRKVFLVA
jgi:hypothetical protein